MSLFIYRDGGNMNIPFNTSITLPSSVDESTIVVCEEQNDQCNPIDFVLNGQTVNVSTSDTLNVNYSFGGIYWTPRIIIEIMNENGNANVVLQAILQNQELNRTMNVSFIDSYTGIRSQSRVHKSESLMSKQSATASFSMDQIYDTTGKSSTFVYSMNGFVIVPGTKFVLLQSQQIILEKYLLCKIDYETKNGQYNAHIMFVSPNLPKDWPYSDTLIRFYQENSFIIGMFDPIQQSITKRSPEKNIIIFVETTKKEVQDNTVYQVVANIPYPIDTSIEIQYMLPQNAQIQSENIRQGNYLLFYLNQGNLRASAIFWVPLETNRVTIGDSNLL